MKAISIVALLSFLMLLSSNVLAQEKRITKPAAVAGETSDRDLDGLNGPVRRVRVEIAKIIVKDGNFTEGPRVLRETSTYDPKGKKIDTAAHPVEGTSLPGKEEYKYDDNGNIVEMILRAEDGSMLSKETYTYELDEIGNWKKMTSSVAIYENGKLVYEPIEVTYRTISYYFGQAVDKLVAAGKKPEAASLKTNDPKPEAASIKVSEPRPQVNETRPQVSKARPQDAETSPAKISQAANTSNEQISVPTGSVVSGPTHSTTQPTLKPIESTPDKVVKTSETLKATASNPENVVKTSETAAAGDSSRQPTKAAHAPAEKILTNTETAAANTVSQPVQPPSAEPTAEKTEDKKANAPTENALARNEVKEPAFTEVKETTSNTKPPESEKTAAAPAEKAPSRVVETAETSTEKITTPARTAPSTATTTPANPAAAAYEQGLNHLAANRFPEAVKSLTESVRLNPNDAQTYLKLGVAYSSQGQHKEAVAVLKMALQIKREVVDAQGFYHLATAYANLGKHSDALDAFKQALYIMRADVADTQSTAKTAPPLAHVYHGLGAMYYSLQRPNDAIKELKRAIELNPKLADAYYVLALSYIAVGNRKSAETQRNTLRNLNAKLANQLDKTLSSHDSGVHCRSVFGPCQ
ncbi:MAG TPA: tetratricopeptide repeat protein [Pyrinomonadaceae bacterium]|nr:tetratricopeptide repeat protein [Pyrinomonadaceae bacterium]